MSLWFTANAVTPHLQARWALDAAAAGWLTTIVQLGFVGGTALVAILNLADLWPARWLVAGSCLLAAGANALVVAGDSYAFALWMRFLTGFFLAGVYPPSMKMMATWFASNRGLAIGALVGALTIGKALPFLIRAWPAISPDFVMLSASFGAIVAGLLIAAAYHDGPYSFERRPFSWKLVGTVVRHRQTRLAVTGYLGHMWELYACWGALSIFFYDFFLGHGFRNLQAVGLSAASAFAAIAAGGIGSVLAGLWADRFGRENIAAGAMAASGACALVIGWLAHSPVWLVLCVAVIWGFAVVADSAQFSALVTEVAPVHAVGTALTLQTSLGFLLTALSMWLTFEIHTRCGWGIAFSMLAVGPVIGIWQILRLKQIRKVEIHRRA